MRKSWLGVVGILMMAGVSPAAGCGSDAVSPGEDASADTAKPPIEIDAVAPDTSTPDTAVPAEKPTAELQILDISDWHGQVDPISETDTKGNPQVYGGLGALATYFKQDRAKNPNTIVLTGGDAFGATPILSGAFKDEPAVKGLSLLGLTADTFGNHNFDNGLEPLKKLIDLATYKFVSTNLENVGAELGAKVVQGFHMVEVAKVKIAILGITNPDAPDLQFPGRMGTLKVQDPAVATEKAAQAARAAGAHVVIVVAHLGATGKDGAGAPTGPLLDYAAKVKDKVDLVLGDHTDQLVNLALGSTRVVENRSKGRTYARVKIQVTAGVVSSVGAEIVDPVLTEAANLTTCDGGVACRCPATACPATYTCSSPTSGFCVRDVVTPDPAAAALLKPYRDQLAVEFDKKVGVVDAELVRNGSLERLGEAPIGDLVADAMLDRYKSQGAQIAFTNGGGIRASLPSSYAPVDKTLRRTSAGYASGPPFDLVLGDIYTVLPFGNTCVVRKITGAKLWTVLERSVGSAGTTPTTYGGFLQIAGFKFEYSAAAAAGSRVQKVTLDGPRDIPRTDATEYTFVTNDFTSAGGDGYTELIQSPPALGRDVMADVLRDYIQAKSPIAVPAGGRVIRLP
ncbi:MAG TPA: 5'-nucleotidase C-terminal domain-containing protein [Polyangiaceae bacterium]|nr:5'-nucleotidase C-terminal domain-containing protein [Polyangiaceae bacterium]